MRLRWPSRLRWPWRLRLPRRLRWPRPHHERRPSARLLTTGGVLVVAALAIGFVAGAVVTSPGQVVADAAPPEPTTLTEPVTTRTVGRSVVFDGTVERLHLTSVVAPPSAGEGEAVVTRLPVGQGAAVEPGTVVAEVSGRPTIALVGELPSYRTLQPGSEGPDVAQLQRAVTALGYPTRDHEGHYGAGTAAAVAALYRDRGYEAQTIGAEAVEAAREALRDAERSLAQTDPSDPQAFGYAREDLSRARSALGTAQAETGAVVQAGEIVYVPELPATVQSVEAQVGGRAQTLLSLVSGPLVVRGAPQSADASQVAVGQRAGLLLSPSGEAQGEVTGSVAVSGDDTETEEAEVSGAREFTVTPAESLPDDTLGSPVRVVVTVEESEGEALTVPVSALSATADGTDTVAVLRNGTPVAVPVTPGFVGDGHVQVTPDDTDALVDGDQVVVGLGGGR